MAELYPSLELAVLTTLHHPTSTAFTIKFTQNKHTAIRYLSLLSLCLSGNEYKGTEVCVSGGSSGESCTRERLGTGTGRSGESLAPWGPWGESLAPWGPWGEFPAPWGEGTRLGGGLGLMSFVSVSASVLASLWWDGGDGFSGGPGLVERRGLRDGLRAGRAWPRAGAGVGMELERTDMVGTSCCRGRTAAVGLWPSPEPL